MIIIAVTGLFADCCTVYISAVVVSDADCVISDQDRVWRVTPLKLDHGCINRRGTYRDCQVIFYQEETMVLYTCSIAFDKNVVSMFLQSFCSNNVYMQCMFLNVRTWVADLVIRIIGAVTQTGVFAGTS